MPLYGFNSQESIKRVTDATKKVEGLFSGVEPLGESGGVIFARITEIIDAGTSGSGQIEIKAEQVIPILDGSDVLTWSTPSGGLLWDDSVQGTNSNACNNLRKVDEEEQTDPEVDDIVIPWEGLLNGDSASDERSVWFFTPFKSGSTQEYFAQPFQSRFLSNKKRYTTLTNTNPTVIETPSLQDSLEVYSGRIYLPNCFLDYDDVLDITETNISFGVSKSYFYLKITNYLYSYDSMTMSGPTVEIVEEEDELTYTEIETAKADNEIIYILLCSVEAVTASNSSDDIEYSVDASATFAHWYIQPYHIGSVFIESPVAELMTDFSIYWERSRQKYTNLTTDNPEYPYEDNPIIKGGELENALGTFTVDDFSLETWSYATDTYVYLVIDDCFGTSPTADIQAVTTKKTYNEIQASRKADGEWWQLLAMTETLIDGEESTDGMFTNRSGYNCYYINDINTGAWALRMPDSAMMYKAKVKGTVPAYTDYAGDKWENGTTGALESYEFTADIYADDFENATTGWTDVTVRNMNGGRIKEDSWIFVKWNASNGTTGEWYYCEMPAINQVVAAKYTGATSPGVADDEYNLDLYLDGPLATATDTDHACVNKNGCRMISGNWYSVYTNGYQEGASGLPQFFFIDNLENCCDLTAAHSEDSYTLESTQAADVKIADIWAYCNSTLNGGFQCVDEVDWSDQDGGCPDNNDSSCCNNPDGTWTFVEGGDMFKFVEGSHSSIGEIQTKAWSDLEACTTGGERKEYPIVMKYVTDDERYSCEETDIISFSVTLEGEDACEECGGGESACVTVNVVSSCAKLGYWFDDEMVVARLTTTPSDAAGSWGLEGSAALLSQVELVDNGDETDNSACIVVKVGATLSTATLPLEDENTNPMEYLLIPTFTPTACA